jgi:hypothetical protein
MKEAGTSYHVHFDIQVPTKLGWVFVNPYMTLVAAYERLIGERGTEFSDPSIVATTDPANAGAASAVTRIEPDPPKRSRQAKHRIKKSKARHPQHQAQQRHE